MLERLFEDFVAYADSSKLPLEGIAVADGERVLLEHHFTRDIPRNIYSHTKSFMSAAAGIAIGEGLLSLDTRLADTFPDKVPDDAADALYDITLRHLLTMSSGFGQPYLMGSMRRAGMGYPDYVRFMLRRPVRETPGSRFQYSTADSILAGRMVEQATGKLLSQYLYEKIFEPLEIGFPLWEHSPDGHPIGGGGMSLRLTDMLKLGQLYLNGGRWHGAQLVPENWVRACGTKQIDTFGGGDIWVCGYSYQFWLSPYQGAYRADGAYGQITTILPESGLAVAVQCPEDGNFALVKQALHEMLLSRL